MTDQRNKNAALAAYAETGVGTVGGLLQSGSIAILWSLIELQDAFGMAGDVAEIGVFQGKTFLMLAHALNAGERAFAVECFGQPPGSDAETLAAFQANMARFGFAGRCETIVADTGTLDADAFRARLGTNIRLFSVDGAHDHAAVMHDLALAESVLAPGGLIAADDLFNPWWPGTTEAIYDFVRAGTHDLVPVALVAANGPVETGAGKLILARAAHASRYKAGLKLLNQPDLKHCDPFAGHRDVPCFYFSAMPQRWPLDDRLRKILMEIAPSP
jgi:predicted O-methyltransferase YrrM